MSFTALIPQTGLAGWSALKRSISAQQTVLQNDPAIKRDVAHFQKNIGKISSADALLADRQTLRVALTAFGLESDINATAFLKKILTDGTSSSAALANRLADQRYRDFAAAFDFSAQSTGPQSPGFSENLLDHYYARRFESAVGEQENSFRLALNAERELTDLAGSTLSETAKWYRILGSKPLREVFETTFGLPNGFSTLDIDRQVAILKKYSKSQFGSETISQFSQAASLEKLTRLYVVRDALNSNGTPSAAQNALTLLSRSTG